MREKYLKRMGGICFNRLNIVKIFLLIFTLIFLKIQGMAKENNLYAGASKKSITPKESVYLAGFDLNRASVGIHDEIYARCLILRINEKSLVFVSLDLIGLFRDEIEKIREDVCKKIKIEKENIIIACTHLHSGPDTLGLWGPSLGITGLSKKYMHFLRKQVVDCILETYKKMKKAKIKLAKIDAPGISENIRDKEIIDNEISIMKVEDIKGQTIALLINYACHPEVLWSENLQITADFPGYLNDHLEKTIGGIGIYFNGALGGMVTPNVKERTFEEAERIGKSIAQKTIEATKYAKYTEIKDFILKRKVFDIALENLFLEVPEILQVVERQLYDGKIRTEVCLIEFGDAQIVTIPGEILPKLGLRIKNELKKSYKFLFGICNDELGYILPPEDFQSDKYEYERTRSVGKAIGKVIEESLKEMLEEKK